MSICVECAVRVAPIRKLRWRYCHGNSIMGRWMQVLLILICVGLVVHTTLYLKGTSLLGSILNKGDQPLLITHQPVSLNKLTALQTRPSLGLHHKHHPYQFTINPPSPCSSSTELVIVVITAINNTGDRQAVRETWGSYSRQPVHNTSLVFLLGSTSSPQLQDQLEKENQQYGDIVQEDFVDSYRNLSLKSVALLKWVSLYCNTSTFVLKADDDMYVNVTNLLSALRREQQSKPVFVLGHVFTGARPVQDKKSKWYTPKEAFDEKVYPRYASGTAYSMTTEAAKLLYAASAHVPVFWLEDIYVTGLLSRKAGIKVLHDGGFSYQKQKIDGCHFRRAITGHRYSAEEKRTIYAKVHDPSQMCSRSR